MGGMGRMKTPLYDAVIGYNPSVRLHMPGVSGETYLSSLYSSAPFDITELDFSDNLHNANGVIAESERLTADAYGSKHCLYFTSGATTAIFCAILTAKEYVNKLYSLGTPHKSIVNACELFNIDFEAVEILPKDCQGIVLTTPDYYGNIISVEKIRESFPNAFIIVDEAHGAHYPYSTLLPKNVTVEADIVINGLHKTLPVYTGGAILRTNSDELLEKALRYRSKLHTTSPSYLTMCSMDFARGYMQENGEKLYSKIKESIDDLKLPYGFKKVHSDDFTRLVIEVPPSTNGYAVARKAQESGIYFELVEDRLLVAIVTPFNYNKLKLLETLDASALPEYGRDLSELIGTIATKDIGLYPPGKVYIKKGEIITAEIVEILQRDAQRIFGLK